MHQTISQTFIELEWPSCYFSPAEAKCWGKKLTGQQVFMTAHMDELVLTLPQQNTE